MARGYLIAGATSLYCTFSDGTVEHLCTLGKSILIKEDCINKFVTGEAQLIHFDLDTFKRWRSSKTITLKTESMLQDPCVYSNCKLTSFDISFGAERGILNICWTSDIGSLFEKDK